MNISKVYIPERTVNQLIIWQTGTNTTRARKMSKYNELSIKQIHIISEMTASRLFTHHALTRNKRRGNDARNHFTPHTWKVLDLTRSIPVTTKTFI